MTESFIFAGFLFVACVIGGFLWDRRNTPEAQLRRAAREFMEDCDARGLSFNEMMEEGKLRRNMAEMRRIASERALADPVHGFGIMKAEIDAATARIASADKKLAWTFKKASQDWALSDCMTPDAVAAVMKANPPVRMPRATPEQMSDLIVAMKRPR